MSVDWDELRERFDPRGIAGVLVDYPEMLEKGDTLSVEPLPASKVFVLSGMGGSAQAAELYRDALGPEAPFQLYINRSYHLPAWVDKTVPVIISSYSGNTEEALAVFDEALARRVPLAVMASGGELEKRAQKAGTLFVKQPLIEGLPAFLTPRFSLPYGFGGITRLLPGPKYLLSEAAARLRALQQNASSENPAVKIAMTAHRRLPSLYLDQAWQGVGKVWQAHFNENAKSLLEVAVLSEANHNEILTWQNDELPRAGVFLSSALDSHPVGKRFDFMRKQWPYEHVEHHSTEKDRLLAVWEMTYLGLWVSYYLAMLRGVDPSDITTLEKLKEYLRKSS